MVARITLVFLGFPNAPGSTDPNSRRVVLQLPYGYLGGPPSSPLAKIFSRAPPQPVGPVPTIQDMLNTAKREYFAHDPLIDVYQVLVYSGAPEFNVLKPHTPAGILRDGDVLMVLNNANGLGEQGFNIKAAHQQYQQQGQPRSRMPSQSGRQYEEQQEPEVFTPMSPVSVKRASRSQQGRPPVQYQEEIVYRAEEPEEYAPSPSYPPKRNNGRKPGPETRTRSLEVDDDDYEEEDGDVQDRALWNPFRPRQKSNAGQPPPQQPYEEEYQGVPTVKVSLAQQGGRSRGPSNRPQGGEQYGYQEQYQEYTGSPSQRGPQKPKQPVYQQWPEDRPPQMQRNNQEVYMHQQPYAHSPSYGGYAPYSNPGSTLSKRPPGGSPAFGGFPGAYPQPQQQQGGFFDLFKPKKAMSEAGYDMQPRPHSYNPYMGGQEQQYYAYEDQGYPPQQYGMRPASAPQHQSPGGSTRRMPRQMSYHEEYPEHEEDFYNAPPPMKQGRNRQQSAPVDGAYGRPPQQNYGPPRPVRQASGYQGFDDDQGEEIFPVKEYRKPKPSSKPSTPRQQKYNEDVESEEEVTPKAKKPAANYSAPSNSKKGPSDDGDYFNEPSGKIATKSKTQSSQKKESYNDDAGRFDSKSSKKQQKDRPAYSDNEEYDRPIKSSQPAKGKYADEDYDRPAKASSSSKVKHQDEEYDRPIKSSSSSKGNRKDEEDPFEFGNKKQSSSPTKNDSKSKPSGSAKGGREDDEDFFDSRPKKQSGGSSGAFEDPFGPPPKSAKSGSSSKTKETRNNSRPTERKEEKPRPQAQSRPADSDSEEEPPRRKENAKDKRPAMRYSDDEDDARRRQSTTRDEEDEFFPPTKSKNSSSPSKVRYDSDDDRQSTSKRQSSASKNSTKFRDETDDEDPFDAPPPPKGKQSSNSPQSSKPGPKSQDLVKVTESPSKQGGKGGANRYHRAPMRKAILIGINYIGQGKVALKGCINDVKNVYKMLTGMFGFQDTPETMIVLTDETNDPKKSPTKANILRAFQWLTADPVPGDVYYVHFSGHGSQQASTDSYEDLDETLVPVDFVKNGQITDNHMNELLVRPLVKGIKMFVCFDCCHSGTALDLPFIYNENGKLKCEPEFKSKSSTMERRSTPAEVVFFSGCTDEQTSADATIDGNSSGAMTYALLETIQRSKKKLTFDDVIKSVRDIIKQKKYKQIPQMSAGHQLDFNQPFFLELP
ncbi:Ca(2+)-dependent cysteine protease [Chytridiales sp. JEL 0842]|nr:Ca(2+)-dependent cysteine protease [Chytridiales sp. JEL 0842]